jgi:uncharacterized protein
MADLVPFLRMRWEHLLFMHWPVTPARLRELVPPCFELDTFEGSAWVGLIPFTMRDVSPVFLPRIPWRGVTDFHECNVRTYVRYGPERGVYFFSLDAASRLGVWGARTFFHLPYFNARMALERRGDEIDYAVDRLDEPRAGLRCRWRAGAPLPESRPGELAHFLTERYSLLTTDPQGRPRICRIRHRPWPLRNAELLELDDSLVHTAGIPLPDLPPLLHHADRLDMRASLLTHPNPRPTPPRP